MANRMFGAAVIDAPAIALSSLCLIHCLFLPVASAILPIAAAWVEVEWVHQAFVIAALPLAVWALSSNRVTWRSGSLIFFGIGLLLGGAFVEAWHDYETPMTVVGAVLLALGHAMRWTSHEPRQS